MSDTEIKLRDWRTGQVQAERLCAGVLAVEGYSQVSPQAPLGGPDGGRDIIALRGRLRCIAAVYFPTVDKAEDSSEVRAKFESDLGKAVARQAGEFVFMTNQRMSPGLRDELVKNRGIEVAFFERERLRHVLDSPAGLGLRLEYLGLPMTPEEQLTHWREWKDAITSSMDSATATADRLRAGLESYIDDRLGELRSRNLAMARIVVMMANAFQMARRSIGELQRSRPLLAKFAESSAIVFRAIEPEYRAYVAEDARLDQADREQRLRTCDSWRTWVDSACTVFSDGKEDEFDQQIRAAFDKVVNTLDPSCPRSVDEIQKELSGDILLAMAKAGRPAARLQLLHKLFMESDEMIEKLLDQQITQTDASDGSASGGRS